MVDRAVLYHIHISAVVSFVVAVQKVTRMNSRVFNDKYRLHYLVGIDGYSRHAAPPGSVRVHFKDSCAYLSRPEFAGTVDVWELFGGEPAVGKFYGVQGLILLGRRLGTTYYDILLYSHR